MFYSNFIQTERLHILRWFFILFKSFGVISKFQLLMKNVVRFCFRYLTLYGKCSSPFFKEKYTVCYSKSNFHVEMGITISNFFYIKQIFFPENYPVPKTLYYNKVLCWSTWNSFNNFLGTSNIQFYSTLFYSCTFLNLAFGCWRQFLGANTGLAVTFCLGYGPHLFLSAPKYSENKHFKLLGTAAPIFLEQISWSHFASPLT